MLAVTAIGMGHIGAGTVIAIDVSISPSGPSAPDAPVAPRTRDVTIMLAEQAQQQRGHMADEKRISYEPDKIERGGQVSAANPKEPPVKPKPPEPPPAGKTK